MPDRHTIATAVLRWGSTSLLAVCVAFWGWFALAAGYSEGPQSFAPVAGFVGALAALLVSGVLLPRIGGVLALAGAGFSAWFFDSGAARLMLALPIAFAGLGLVVAGPWRRTPWRRTQAGVMPR
jgi:hypothetical protein